MEELFQCVSRDGVPIRDRGGKSHIHGNIHQHLRKEFELLCVRNSQEVIKNTCVVLMGAGTTECVKTSEGDDIVYQVRGNRKGPTRFVLNKLPQATNKLTYVLIRNEENGKLYYWIATAYAGEPAPPEPWDDNAFQRDSRGYEIAKKESEDFWANYALVLH